MTCNLTIFKNVSPLASINLFPAQFSMFQVDQGLRRVCKIVKQNTWPCKFATLIKTTTEIISYRPYTILNCMIKVFLKHTTIIAHQRCTCKRINAKIIKVPIQDNHITILSTCICRDISELQKKKKNNGNIL